VITSNPHYTQSNGLAERGVGIEKDMLKKNNYTDMDINSYLLVYRNTPITGLQYASKQRAEKYIVGAVATWRI